MNKAYFWKYVWATLKHKWYVFRAGLKTGAPLYNLIIHDYSKFSPQEVFGYSRHFYGDKGDLEKFRRAWIHHQNTNPHHWEYWMPRTSHSLERKGGAAPGPLPMPEKYVREMVADWFGAAMSYEGQYPKSFDTWTWFHKNVDRFKTNMHSATLDTLEKVLREVFNDRDIYI